MNTHELFQYHLRVAEQSNKCADILKMVHQAKIYIAEIKDWMNTPDLDRKMISITIKSQKDRMTNLESKVIPRLMRYYQSELIKLDQIYKA